MAQQSWTADSPANTGSAIKAIHPDELQEAVDAYNTAYGQAAAVWHNTPIAATEAIEWETFADLMDEIDVIGAASTKGGAYVWVEAQPTGAGDDITAALLEEIRTNMNDLQHNYCITCDTCDNHACDCDPACNADACALCDAVCNEHSCTCNASCHSDLCDTCNASCNGYSCDCNPACNGDCTNCSTCYSCNSEGCTKADACAGCVSSCNSNPCSPCNGTCNVYTACTCNSSCDGDVCDLCDATCNGESCTCNASCHNDACDTCDGTCNVDTCDQCNGVAYRYPWT